MLESMFGNIDIVEKSLNGLTARQRVIGENIANADTPKYKRMEVAYEAQLRAAMKSKEKNASDDLELATNDARHFSVGPMASSIDDVHATLTQVTDETFRVDGNNVDIDTEMAKMAETNIRFNTMATVARNKFDGLKNVLREIR